MADSNKEQQAPAQETEKTVKIRLPLIPGAEKQAALFVSCNNREMVIPRGVETEVPECMAEIIRHSEDMQYQAALLRMKLQQKAE